MARGRRLVALAALICIHAGSAMTLRRANPIRRVVTMIQAMSKKVEEEGEAEEKMYEKFFCYCSNGAEKLGGEIADAQTKIPQLESSIQQTTEEIAQLGAGLAKSKQSRGDAKDAVGTATSLRAKEAAAFAAYSTETKANIDAMGKAVAALEKGVGGSFLQTSSAPLLRKITINLDMTSSDRDTLTSFLSTGSDSASGDSNEIIGILKQLKETMEGDLSKAGKTEDASIADFNGLTAAKAKEISALSKSIEDAITRNGDASVELTQLKGDLSDTSDALVENQKFLADMDKNCAAKKAEWEERQKMRASEQVALTDTIKMLNSDDALELFKKTLPGSASSFLQVQVTAKDMKQRALAALKGHKSMRLDLVSMALRGRKVNFDKVLAMVADMITLLKKEQDDDDSKKEYCEATIDKTEDEIKGLKDEIADLEKAMSDTQASIETLASEIAVLVKGVSDLDIEVAGASAQRKQENAEFKQVFAQNTAAIDLLKMAKTRLNKFYNPKLALAQVSDEADSDQPETPAAYGKKGAESGGVIAMLDLIIGDVTKENTTMEQEDKDAQADYEKFMTDSSEKRAQDMHTVADKEGNKAGNEEMLDKLTEKHKARSDSKFATEETLNGLHQDCDFLLQNYEMRKNARAGEVEALTKAKAILNGADYSL